MSTTVGGPPVNHTPEDSIRGRNQAVPALPSPSVNGNGFPHDHARKPSMTVTPAGTTSYGTNGAQNKPIGIQFGSHNTGNGQSALGTPQMAAQSSANLGVNAVNQRAASPQGSPSPIVQPASVSGGPPRSSFQSQANGVSFGQMGTEGGDPTGLARPMSNISFNAQDVHMRRSSSQSIHADMNNGSLPTGPGRGNYPSQAGRGRGGGNYGYQGQMPYSPHQSFSPTPAGRGGMRPNYQGRGSHMQYQGSPQLGTRSPMMHNPSPGTPQMGQMNMMTGMQGQPGYSMPYPVGHTFSLSMNPVRGRQNPRARARGTGGRRGRGPGGGSDVPTSVGRDPALEQNARAYSVALLKNFAPAPAFLFPDLSPESGNFEHFLTQQKQGYPTQPDPSISYMYANAFPQMQQQYYQNTGPPQSPRPPFQQTGYNQPIMQYGQGAPDMSRQSSQMSTTTTDRPGSSIGQNSHTPAHGSTRTPSMSAQPKPEFTLPKKTNAALVIKNAAGEVLDFKKQSASSSAATPATSTPAVPTPPSRTGSAADHTRSESTAKTDEEKKKAFQEAVAKNAAKADKAHQDQEAEKQSSERAQMDKEDAEAAQRKAEEAAREAAALEQEAQAAREAEDNKQATSQPEMSEPAPAAAADDEPDFDAIEAEMAAIEAEEARREEEYQKKKAAEREEQARKKAEEDAAWEANMKENERRAEEEELAREQKRAAGLSTDAESKKLFASLKGSDAAGSSAAEDSAAPTPAESGTATPVSDTSMPPPKGAVSNRKKAADLVLDTKKSLEPPEPSDTLKALVKAKLLQDLSQVHYPEGVAAPDAALNASAPADRKFKYDQGFLLQFQAVYKDKPTLDWDAKIRDALGDPESSARPGTARTPSGMGPRNPSRTSAAGGSSFQPMGAFGGRPSLPAGSTSEQRFAAANAAMRGGPMAPNPFAFGRPGSMGPPTGRTPSNNPLGGIPGSPRAGGPSRGGQRNESKRNKQGAKHEAEANKSMPLTAGMNIGALETSTTGWKPRSLTQPANAGPTPGGEALMEPDVVQRKVKAALNKMTPEKFDRIADQILDIAAQSKHESDGRTLRQVIQLTFEKATDEAHWAPMYAMFCRKMLQSMSSEIKDENIKDKNGDVVTGGNLFRKYLLNRCQEEFERGWKVNLPPRKEGETEEAAILSEEYYVAAAAKRRGLGLVKFIGELFKLGMLTERIMHECVKKLVDYEGTPEESEVESLTSLLRTIGKQLDSSESKAQGRMDVYFERIKHTIALPDLPSRLRFMLMDVVDLRKHSWVSKSDDKGPKTIAEIREEAERAAQQAEMQRLAQQAGRGGGGRMAMGRGDARSVSYGQVPPPDNSNRVGADDLRRLGGRAPRNPSSAGTQSLGPSLMGGRTNSGRRGLGPSSFLGRGDDSNASSRTGTPPAQKEDKKKDESGMNAFSALASLEGQEEHEDPASPPAQKSQPATAAGSQTQTAE